MDRTFKIALTILLFNIAFAIYHIAQGLYTHSRWLLTIGVYYVVLSTVRFVVIKAKKNGRLLTVSSGIILMILSVTLVGTVILAVIRDRGIVMHEIAMIAMALYSFTKITLAIINLVRARKSNSARLITLRNVSLADACVSIFTLQRSMLVSFGDMSVADIRIFNAATGAAVCIVVFLLGLWLVKRDRLKQSDI